MLYIVSTPIGNLGDFTFRASKVLLEVDYILCEDTRRSQILLEAYAIKKPLKSYHSFNAAQREETIIADLKEGKQIALLSDAGTPLISDPGERLTLRCQAEKLPFTSLPGPCAPIVALTLSGFNPIPFQFIGFLSKKTGELKKALVEALFYPGTTICFESPNRIHSTLELLNQMAPTRELAIARELTKKYEQIHKGTASELLIGTYLGEITLLLSPAPALDFSELDPKEHVAQLQEDYGLTKQEAIKMAAELRQVSKKQLYF